MKDFNFVNNSKLPVYWSLLAMNSNDAFSHSEYWYSEQYAMDIWYPIFLKVDMAL